MFAEAAKHYDEEALGVLVVAIAAINAWNRLNVISGQVTGEWVRQWAAVPPAAALLKSQAGAGPHEGGFADRRVDTDPKGPDPAPTGAGQPVGPRPVACTAAVSARGQAPDHPVRDRPQVGATVRHPSRVHP